MKVVIPGGTGQVGTVLARAFDRGGHKVVLISRQAEGGPWRTVQWDGTSHGEWDAEIDGADVVINLAGRSVNCRYHVRNRQEIKQSRVLTTRLIGEAIAAAARPPRVWLQASTATIYIHRFDTPNDEATGILGNNPDDPDTWHFSYDVAESWERELDNAEVPGTRKVKLRSAITLSPDRGGAFDLLLTLVRFGLGGKAGHGRQYVSWIHDADFARAVQWIIDREEISGAINLAAPNPLPNAAFMRDLRAAWGMPLGLPAAKWMIEIGTFLMRTESELVLKSRRVIPGILQERGFEFRFPSWPEAARDLCRRRRKAVAEKGGGTTTGARTS